MLDNLRQLFRYRALISSLVARELKARYRGSVLGFFWSFVNPLLLLLIYTFVFSVVLSGVHPPELEPYALFMVELRYFGGLSIEETADVLGVTPTTIKRHWRFAKAWLHVGQKPRSSTVPRSDVHE